MGGSSVLKKSSKGIQCQKIVDLQKCHPAKAATSGVNQMLQESQAETSLDSKTRAVKEEAKLAELLAEELFLTKKQFAEKEAERLKFKRGSKG